MRLTDRIIDEICGYTGIDKVAFFSKRRDEDIVFSRHAFCYFIYTNKDFYKLSLERIGRLTCKTDPQDHATVLNAIRKFQNRIDCRDQAAIDIIRCLSAKFPSCFVRFGLEKEMTFNGFVSFKKRPMDDTLIEVKNDIPFAIGFYDSAENCVRSHGQKIEIDGEYEWRYYL